MACLSAVFPAATTFYAFPRAHWRRIRSTKLADNGRWAVVVSAVETLAAAHAPFIDRSQRPSRLLQSGCTSEARSRRPSRCRSVPPCGSEAVVPAEDRNRLGEISPGKSRCATGSTKVWFTYSRCSSSRGPSRWFWKERNPSVRSTKRNTFTRTTTFMDSESGLIHAELRAWFPFQIQVHLDGHEWLARKLDRCAIEFLRILQRCSAGAMVDACERALRRRSVGRDYGHGGRERRSPATVTDPRLLHESV
jgi:hypothetical protein